MNRIIYKCPICHKAFVSSRDTEPLTKEEIVAAELAGKMTINGCSTDCHLKIIENIVQRDTSQFVRQDCNPETVELIKQRTTKILEDQFLHMLKEYGYAQP